MHCAKKDSIYSSSILGRIVVERTVFDDDRSIGDGVGNNKVNSTTSTGVCLRQDSKLFIVGGSVAFKQTILY